MLQKTSLYLQHCSSNATLTDFFGWEMPLHYGSQLQEHQNVREDAGLFDVSHMGIIDIQGRAASAFLRFVLANDVAKLVPNKALYSCLLNPAGGVLDDLIVYCLQPDYYRLVVNAGTCLKDFDWLQQQAQNFTVQLQLLEQMAIIAVQGPNAITHVQALLPAEQAQQLASLKPFHFCQVDNNTIARTGYTGEDGVEILCDATQAVPIWQQLLEQGVLPCGLAARDTLRLEAGFNLYGQDMDEQVTPLESNLAWTVAMQDDREFIGKSALQKQKQQGVPTRLVGLVMRAPGVLRNQQIVFSEHSEQQGYITSGGFSPTLGYAIALARIPMTLQAPLSVERRGQRVAVELVKPPFVKKS